MLEDLSEEEWLWSHRSLFLSFSISITKKSLVSISAKSIPEDLGLAQVSTVKADLLLGYLYTADASVLDKDSWQVLYELWSKNHLSTAFQRHGNQPPKRNENSICQVGDTEVFKISAFGKTGKHLLKYLVKEMYILVKVTRTFIFIFIFFNAWIEHRNFLWGEL